MVLLFQFSLDSGAVHYKHLLKGFFHCNNVIFDIKRLNNYLITICSTQLTVVGYKTGVIGDSTEGNSVENVSIQIL